MNTILKPTFISLVTVLFLLLSVATSCAQDQQMEPEETEFYEPEVAKVEPGEDIFIDAPSDAIILFDGSDTDQWQSVNGGGEVEWEIEDDGALTVVPGTGWIETKESFGDVQLYIEWRSPMNMEHEGQDRGNSGIFFQSLYEVQVLDAWNNPTYINGMAGSVYKQTSPLVNPSKRPGEWESYNISYKAPRFNDDGSLAEPARVTVIWNGVVVQNNTEIYGPTEYIGYPEYEAHGKAPIQLQDHDSKVSYRNIWIRPLDNEQFSIQDHME
ncbi:MAG: DUF1080 domain-containing protein [Bacteroidetes bacterium]|jgi:hypothetical protein|nr:DUF1080 domain-containing protein [Bacteroidota bacterium]